MIGPPIVALPRSAGTRTPRATMHGRPTAELASRLDLVAEALRQRGAQPAAERWAAWLPEGSGAAVRIRVRDDRCLGFIAVAHESMSNADLFVHNAAGERVAWDEHDDPHPFARTCARRGEVLWIVVEARTGSGEVGLLTMVDPPADAPDLASVLHADRPGIPAAPRSPRPPVVAETLAADAPRAWELHAARFVSLGFARSGPLYSGRIDGGGVEARDVTLEANHCYVILAAGGRGIEDLELRVVPPAGEPLRERLTDSHPVVRICPMASGRHRLELTAGDGAGMWAMGVLHLVPPPNISSDIVGEQRASSVEIVAEGMRRRFGLMRPIQRHAVSAGVRISMPVWLRAGRCYLFGAAADADVPDLDLAVFDARRRLLAADTVAISQARAFVCARSGRRVTVEVSVQSGRGEIALVAMHSTEATR